MKYGSMTVNDGLQRMREEAEVAYFKMPCFYLPGGQKNHDKPKDRTGINSQVKSEPDTRCGYQVPGMIFFVQLKRSHATSSQ
jgi:hypothetical protein